MLFLCLLDTRILQGFNFSPLVNQDQVPTFDLFRAMADICLYCQTAHRVPHEPTPNHEENAGTVLYKTFLPALTETNSSPIRHPVQIMAIN